MNSPYVQVNWLRNENHLLMNKLNNLSKSHDKALEENAQLKQETSRLRQMATKMKIMNSHNYPSLKLLQLDDDEPCGE